MLIMNWIMRALVITNHNFVSCITQNGASPLQLAAGKGKTDVVVELVKNGANLNLQDEVCHYIQLHVPRLLTPVCQYTQHVN